MFDFFNIFSWNYFWQYLNVWCDFLVIAFADGPGVLSERESETGRTAPHKLIFVIMGKVALCFSGVMFWVFDLVIDIFPLCRTQFFIE